LSILLSPDLVCACSFVSILPLVAWLWRGTCDLLSSHSLMACLTAEMIRIHIDFKSTGVTFD